MLVRKCQGRWGLLNELKEKAFLWLGFDIAQLPKRRPSIIPNLFRIYWENSRYSDMILTSNGLIGSGEIRKRKWFYRIRWSWKWFTHIKFQTASNLLQEAGWEVQILLENHDQTLRRQRNDLKDRLNSQMRVKIHSAPLLFLFNAGYALFILQGQELGMHNFERGSNIDEFRWYF